MNSRGQKRIMYAIDSDTGLIWSRYESQLAIPMIDFEKMNPENSFEIEYHLEKHPMHLIHYAHLKWTRKIPIAIKNMHRKFWGMPLLKITNCGDCPKSNSICTQSDCPTS